MDDDTHKENEEYEENLVIRERQQKHVQPIIPQGTGRYILVAALHFGHMFTKCVWSLRDFLEKDTPQFYMSFNYTTGQHDTPLSYETCAILLDKNKKLISFGDEAKEEYADICTSGNEVDFYMFSQFTTSIKNKKNFSRDMMLEDVIGKPVLACTVFELYIKALTNYLKNEWSKQNAVENDEIRWVFAISADVSESGKRFIRSCIEQAGIPSGQSMLVTESEAAFTFCLKLLEFDPNQTFKDGKDYMIVNLEDYGADITVVRKEKYQLIEQYRTKCEEFLDTTMDERFVEFLDEIIGKPVIKSYKYKDATEYNDIIRAVRNIKKQIGENEKGMFTIRLPFVYLDSISHKARKRNFKSLVDSSRFSKKVKVISDKMRIENDIFRNLVKPTIDKVISFLETVFKQYKHVTNVMDVVVVGGFAEYKLLQEVVRQKFFTKRIIFPKSPELVVVKGAALCPSESYQYIRSLSSEACTEYLDVAQSQTKRLQKLIDYEHEQRMKLENMVEQLPKEQVSLEVQAKKSLNLQKNGKEKGTTGSDEDDFFDALDYHADEFEVALPHEIMTHRRMLSDTSEDSHIIPDDRSSNGSDTEKDGQEARVYSHINKYDSPKRSVGYIVMRVMHGSSSYTLFPW